MKIQSLLLGSAMAGAIALGGCQQDTEPAIFDVPGDILDQLNSAGFSTTDVIRFEDGFLVEGDIYLTAADIADMSAPIHVAGEHYRTTNLVSGPRNITLSLPVGGNNGFSTTYLSALNEAVSRYNGENLTLTFSVTTSKKADIKFSRLASRDEQRGVLGSAGFPSGGGAPYGSIKMSGILESTYGLSVNGIATIMAHEMGHCIGFRHTDYMDRSYSCGGQPYNEGDGGVGAIHIPGTPTGPSANSWMLSCTDGGNRDFTNADKTALDYLY